MEKPARKLRKYDLATYILMIAGAILFLLTPLFIRWFKLDSDLVGILVFLIGLVMYLAGLIVRFFIKKRRGHSQIK